MKVEKNDGKYIISDISQTDLKYIHNAIKNSSLVERRYLYDLKILIDKFV